MTEIVFAHVAVQTKFGLSDSEMLWDTLPIWASPCCLLGATRQPCGVSDNACSQ